MDILDRATPRLAAAHNKLWHVRETCHDKIMRDALTRALAAVQDTQARLRMIEREALSRRDGSVAMSVRIPLRARDGSVRAYAIVDDEDADLGERRWALGSAGYAQRTVQHGSRRGPAVRKTIVTSLHRAIAERMGIADAPMVDHINRDKLDNRRSNIRPADALLNARNRVHGPGAAPRYFGCTEPECDGKHFAKGKCEKHYKLEAQMRRRRAAGVRPAKIGREPCTVADCDRPQNGRGLCLMHYKRAWRAERKAAA